MRLIQTNSFHQSRFGKKHRHLSLFFRFPRKDYILRRGDAAYIETPGGSVVLNLPALLNEPDIIRR